MTPEPTPALGTRAVSPDHFDRDEAALLLF
jgi:hypothetical protein